MKGGPSIEVLINLALSNDNKIAKKSANILKTQVFLYEDDINRLKKAYESGNIIAKEIIISYANAEFFTSLTELDEEIEVITYVAGVGDISTDSTLTRKRCPFKIRQRATWKINVRPQH